MMNKSKLVLFFFFSKSEPYLRVNVKRENEKKEKNINHKILVYKLNLNYEIWHYKARSNRLKIKSPRISIIERTLVNKRERKRERDREKEWVRERKRETLIKSPFRSSSISVEFFAIRESELKLRQRKKLCTHGKSVRSSKMFHGKIYPSSNHTRPDYIPRRFLIFLFFYSPFLSLYINFGTDLEHEYIRIETSTEEI